ncbi:hypothetical protein IMSHALPRED_000955 [Imshaugia aleurites]|uniref:Dystroglycan-type cadherin-like domain-containing protein n=1 Tax=Imshaugia aleurites TaxID=172621 RepID=A0A8H3EWU5_9LECA|nr:hypothetical protein IMSHALPRED_000955 [Imshaugia aleurites]
MQEPSAVLKHLHKAALLVLLLASSVPIHATPSINLPINAQVPPVARPNQAYSFVFSDSTFSWAGNSINYSLTNSPGWLQLDGADRVFSGTPGSADDGSFAVGLVATDGTGSSSMSVTFVVSTDPGPGLGTSVAEQLPAFGPVPGPDSLALAPSSAMLLSFSPNTFTNTNANTVYYATCANNTPLPSWVNFYPSNLTFSGTTPSSTSPSELPQAFRIQLIASDVVGFAEAVASFQLVIESHVLTFGNSLHIINVTNGLPINFPGLQRDLTLDGQPANSSDLRQVVASPPPWISFNSSTLVLSGTAPADAASQNFTVTASDIYGDTTSTVVLIQSTNNLTSSFLGPFATVNATMGGDFMYDLKSRLASNSAPEIAVDLGVASAWLKFNSSSLELQGYVPTNLEPQSIQVMVTATQGTQSQSQSLTIDLQNASGSSARTADSHTKSTKATSGSTSGRSQTADATSSVSSPNKHWIAAAVIVPIFVALGSLLLLCYCLERRRRRKIDNDQLFSPRWKISRPIQVKNISDTEVRVETPGVLAINEKRASSRASMAPWLDFLGFQAPGHSNRCSGSRLSSGPIGGTDYSTGPDSGAFVFPGRTKDKLLPEVSRVPEMRTPRKSRKTSWGLKAPPLAVQRLSVIMDESPAKRYSKRKQRRSNMNYDTASGFGSKHLSGIGHGRTTLSQGSSNHRLSSKGVGHGNGLMNGPPGFGIVRNSWRNLSRSTWASTDGSSNPGLERETTVGKLQSNTRPPTSDTSGNGSHSYVIHKILDDEPSCKPTLRPVPSLKQSRLRRKSGSLSRSNSNLKADALQSFHKRRLQQRGSRNPLFSAGPSSSRILSIRGSKIAPLQTPLSPSGSTGNKTVSERPVTPQREGNQHSYSESSSIEPPMGTSPSKSMSSTTSQRRQKSYIKYRLNARALSPPNFSHPARMNSRGSSWVSTSSDSKFGSAASEAPPFNGFGEDLREETDEDGNKRWLRGHPNPLGTHRLDVTDQELIDRLRVSGHVSAAQRLSYFLKAQTDRNPDHGVENGGEGGQVKIGSTQGKRLGQSAGMRPGDPGNMSMRGDIGNTTAGSAFI